MRSPLFRLVVCVSILVLLVMQAVPLAFTLLFPFEPHQVGDEVREQVVFLERTLNEEVAARSKNFPQGELFTWQFYGLALQNIAETTQTKADREKAIREVRRILPKLDPLLSRWPYNLLKDPFVRGGVCWMSGQNLLRARLVRMTGAEATPDEVARFHRDSAALATAFALSRSGVLEAVPGLTWPVDSLFGLESLRIHDEVYGTSYFEPAYAKWKKTTAREGLMPAMVTMEGKPRDVPRGCALSWSLAVLPKWDAAFSKTQWQLYKEQMSACRFGLCFFREYPVGKTRGADADSGPMIRGYGMAATAFALAAARANGDSEIAAALQREGELVGIPLRATTGRRYVFGLVPFFDVLSVWVKTVPMPVAAKPPSPFSPIALGYAFAVAALLALTLRSTAKQVRALNVRPTRTFTAPDQPADAEPRALQSPPPT